MFAQALGALHGGQAAGHGGEDVPEVRGLSDEHGLFKGIIPIQVL